MTYDPNASRKGGARKRLVEEVVKQIDLVNDEKLGVIEAYIAIRSATWQYKKETSK